MKLTCQRPALSNVNRAIPHWSGSGRDSLNLTHPTFGTRIAAQRRANRRTLTSRIVKLSCTPAFHHVGRLARPSRQFSKRPVEIPECLLLHGGASLAEPRFAAGFGKLPEPLHARRGRPTTRVIQIELLKREILHIPGVRAMTTTPGSLLNGRV